MSQTLDPVGPTPETRSIRFLTLLFGASAAAIAWLAQLILGYGVTAYVCYPGDHPQMLASSGPLFSALMVFDAVALLTCVASGLVSVRAWRESRHGHGENHFNRHIRQARTRFLALWGIMSSLWFFCAILFNAIASVMVPPCLT